MKLNPFDDVEQELKSILENIRLTKKQKAILKENYLGLTKTSFQIKRYLLK